MTNVSINLLLVKFRQQYGLRAFTEGFLVLYVLVTFFHLFVNDLSSALMVRAAHGMVAAALSSGDLLPDPGLAREAPESADHRHHRLVTRHPDCPPLLYRAATAGRVARSLFLRAWPGADIPGLRDGAQTPARRSQKGL
jgi:hypothetical protein